MRDSNKHYLTAKKESREQAVFTKWLHSRLGKHSFKHYKAFVDKFGYNADAKLAIAINTLSEYKELKGIPYSLE